MHTYSVTQIPETSASFISIGIQTALHKIQTQIKKSKTTMKMYNQYTKQKVAVTYSHIHFHTLGQYHITLELKECMH